MFTSSHKYSKYISIRHDYYQKWYPHDGSRCYFIRLAKKNSGKGKCDKYATKHTELVPMWFQSLYYHIQCLGYLELNSFLFHEEFFSFQLHVECMLFVECTFKMTVIHCDIHEIGMLKFNTGQKSIWALILLF